MQSAPSIPTLQHVLERIEALEPGTQKRDLKSAVKTFCRAVGKHPAAVSVVPSEIRALRESVSPLAAGLSARRWANVCSGLTKAIELVRELVPSRNTTPLLPEWKALLDMLPSKYARKVSAGLRYLSGKGVIPTAVTVADLEEYCDAIVSNRMRRNAEKGADAFLWAWNRTAKTCPDWPQVTVPRQDKRDSYSYPLEYFPASFAADLEAYIGRLTKGIMFDDDDEDIDLGPLRPVRPATAQTRSRQLRAAASCLVHSGVPATDITSIAALVEVRNVKLILNFLMQRSGGMTSGGVAQMASLLAKIALHWVKVDAQHHAKLQRLAGRVAVQHSGMTAKNRERLRPFDDDSTVVEFVCLPDTIRKKVEQDKRPARLKARQAQMAAAIAILLVIPLRRNNLAAIDIHRHLVSNRNGVYLVIPEHETKNREPINFQIPAFALEIVKWYIVGYRPYLLDGESSSLFPGRGGQPKSPHTLAQQIKQTVWEFLGLEFNIHLFRHAAGKIFLDINPGNYEVVRQLLRHKSVNTTTSAYSGAETRKAGLLYAELLEGLRALHAPEASDRRKRA
ncbi:site-specific integrase [Erythrobacter fulvus]|nr:site-specific integrase [Erythrobacter fulvus]